MKTPFGNIVVSEAIPKNEIWFVTPGEQIQILKPGESALEVSFEGDKVMLRRGGTIVKVTQDQIHKLINIGGGE